MIGRQIASLDEEVFAQVAIVFVKPKDLDVMEPSGWVGAEKGKVGP